METGEQTSSLRVPSTLSVGAAVILSLGGTLFGFAGLLMWGFRAADVMVPGAENAPDWISSLFPYATLLSFGLMACITILGLLNLLLALRPEEFLAGGWKRWLIQSAFSIAAAVIFFSFPASV